MPILQVFSVSAPFLDRPAQSVQAFDAFEAAQRIARQLPALTTVVVGCRCHNVLTLLSAYVQGGTAVSTEGYAVKATSVAFHFVAGKRDGVAHVEVLLPGQHSITVSYLIDADGVVAGLTADGARQLLLHIKGKTCTQDFSEYLRLTVERAFMTGGIVPFKPSSSPCRVVQAHAAAQNQNLHAGITPG